MNAFSHIAFAARSDVGKRRKNNEDSFGAFPAAGVFCVADGMGGGDDGEVASAAAVRAVESFAKAYPLPENAAYPASDVAAGIRSCLDDASAWLFERTANRHLKCCGSTFAGVVFDPSRPDVATALHAGDSRVYRIRGSSIQQMTKDHSAAELIGVKDESELNPMFRGMILRAVGVQSTVEVEATPVPVSEGDKILICSDGLYRMVPDRAALEIIRSNDALEQAADALVDAANAAGGVDNVTVVLLAVGKLPAALPVVEMPPANRVKRPGARPELQPDGMTQDTNGDSGVSFDVASADDAGSSDSHDGADEATCATVTIPESEEAHGGADEPPSVQGDATAEKDGGKCPAGTRKKTFVGVIVVLLILAMCGATGLFLRNKTADVKTAEARPQEEPQCVVEPAEDEQKVQKARQEPEPMACCEAEHEDKPDETCAENARKEDEERGCVDLLVEFERVCELEVAGPFVRKVAGFVGERAIGCICTRFRPLRKGSSLSREDRLAAAVQLTRDVQEVVARLTDCVRGRLAEVEERLSDPTTASGCRDDLTESREKLAGFLEAAEVFARQDPADPDAQSACIKFIDSVPHWL